MTKLWRIIVGAALVVLALGITAPLASAQASSPCPPGQPDGRPPGQPPENPGQPNGRPPQYPPGACNLQLSKGSVARGEKYTVYGSGYTPGSTVTITQDPGTHVLATTTANDNGEIQADVTTPSDATLGQNTVTAASADRSLSASLEVVSGAAAVRGATRTSNASVAFTGVEIAGMTTTGVVLILIGSLAVFAARRRRRTA